MPPTTAPTAAPPTTARPTTPEPERARATTPEPERTRATTPEPERARTPTSESPRVRAPAPDDRPWLPVTWSLEWAPFLDIDGTLLDIAAHPDDVFVPPGLIDLLERLEERCGALALVTGRSLDQVDALFGEGRFDCAANHGAVLRIDGTVEDLAGDPRAAHAIAAALVPTIDAHAGTLLEDKGHSVALHYRAAPAAEPLLLAAAYEAIRGEPDTWRIVLGKSVIEIAPRATTKGTAIERFLRHPVFAGKRPFVAGDDTTDEDAFAAIARRDGFGVLIGPERKTGAGHRLPSPDAFRTWLGHSLE